MKNKKIKEGRVFRSVTSKFLLMVCISMYVLGSMIAVKSALSLEIYLLAFQATGIIIV